MPSKPSNLSRDQLEALLHELQVQHIELQVQNRELQDAQQLIEESRGRYADLYDFAPIGYCTISSDGHITEANLTAARLFSMRRNQLIGRHLASLVSVEDRRPLLAHLEEAAHTAEPLTSEVSFTAKTRGERLTVQLVSVKRHEGVLTALIDVSALKDLEQKLGHLAYAGDVLSASLDTTTTLSVVCHLVVPRLADLCFVDLLDDAGRLDRPSVLFGDSVLQERFAAEVRRATLEPGWKSPQRRCIESREPMLLEDATLGGAGARPPWLAGMGSMMILPLKVRAKVMGTLTLAASAARPHYRTADLVFAREIARRAATALENAHLLAQSQTATQQRDNLLAMVSHDLKNPLTVIFGRTASLLKADLANDWPRARGWVGIIRSAAARMKQLIDDLLEVARIEGTGLAVDLVSTPVRALLDEAVGEARHLAAEREIEIAIEYPEGALEVACDRLRVLQVFANLLGNAVKFSPDGGTVTVRAEKSSHDVWFSVADRGAGLAEEHLTHVFNRFWQAKNTARLGTGLGLAIAKGIIDAHRGEILAERREGGGARFSFSLRLSSARLVVIIEDDPVDRELLSSALELKGYRVATATDGAAGLELLRRLPSPTVVLLDLQMPVMDGWQFLNERQHDPLLQAIPVVVVSGVNDLEATAVSRGVGYVQKPFQVDQLLAVLDQAVVGAGGDLVRAADGS